MPLVAAAKAAHACVIPVVAYGAEVWYKGPVKPLAEDTTRLVKLY